MDRRMHGPTDAQDEWVDGGWKDRGMAGWLNKLLSLPLGWNCVRPCGSSGKDVPVLMTRIPGDRVYSRLLSSWLPGPEAPCCPAPTCSPEEGASFLPGCCLSRCPSLPAAGSTVILASAALPLPSSSWPRNWLLPSPGQWPWPSRRTASGRHCAEVREARVHTSSLCCQQPWAGRLLGAAHWGPGGGWAGGAGSPVS